MRRNTGILWYECFLCQCRTIFHSIQSIHNGGNMAVEYITLTDGKKHISMSITTGAGTTKFACGRSQVEYPCTAYVFFDDGRNSSVRMQNGAAELATQEPFHAIVLVDDCDEGALSPFVGRKKGCKLTANVLLTKVRLLHKPTACRSAEPPRDTDKHPCHTTVGLTQTQEGTKATCETCNDTVCDKEVTEPCKNSAEHCSSPSCHDCHTPDATRVPYAPNCAPTPSAFDNTTRVEANCTCMGSCATVTGKTANPLCEKTPQPMTTQSTAAPNCDALPQKRTSGAVHTVSAKEMPTQPVPKSAVLSEILKKADELYGDGHFFASCPTADSCECSRIPSPQSSASGIRGCSTDGSPRTAASGEPHVHVAESTNYADYTVMFRSDKKQKQAMRESKTPYRTEQKIYNPFISVFPFSSWKRVAYGHGMYYLEGRVKENNSTYTVFAVPADSQRHRRGNGFARVIQASDGTSYVIKKVKR